MALGRSATKNMKSPSTGQDALKFNNGFSPLNEHGSLNMHNEPGNTSARGQSSDDVGVSCNETPLISK